MGRAAATARKCAPFIPSSLLCQTVCSLVLCHLDYYHLPLKRCTKQGSKTRSGLLPWVQQLKWPVVEKRLAANLLVYFHCVNNTQTLKFLFKKIIYSSEIRTQSTSGASSGQMILPRPKPNDLKNTVPFRMAPASERNLFHQRKGAF